MLFRESTISCVNNKGTNLRTRKCWLVTTKLGTMPATVYYLDKPEKGKTVRCVLESDRWTIHNFYVDDINDVCVFLSR
jgi:hypothetical protein